MTKTKEFEVITRAAESALAVKDFIEGRGLRDTLAAIYGKDLGTAQKALERFATPEEKQAAIAKVIARLQAAHDKYQKLHQSAAQGWRKDLCMQILTKDIFTCCLMALCHQYLKAGKAAVESALTAADIAFESSIYLTDYNQREERASTAAMDAAIGSFWGRLSREDINDREVQQLWQDKGARVTDSFLGIGTFLLNAINPFYYKHLGELRGGKVERIDYETFAELKTNLLAIAAGQ